MSSIRLTDRQWAFIRPYLPPPACTGRPRGDDRWTIEGILYVLITGCQWQDLPHLAGEYERVWGELLGLGAAGRTVLGGALRTLCSPSHVRLAVRSLSSISQA
jgi:hypothetical protein